MGGRMDHSRAADMQILESLWLRDVCGWPATQVAQHLGKSKGQIIGFWFRIDNEMKRDNGVGNGTMPEKWWKQ